MRNSFSWRHAIALVVIVGLLSIVAGAVLAQDEPDLPEPEVPQIDLSASAQEPVEPVEPEVAAPAVIVIEPAVVETAPTGVNPPNGGVVPTLFPTFNWDPIPNVDGYEFAIWEYRGGTVLPDGASYEPFIPGLGSPLTFTFVQGNTRALTETGARVPNFLTIQAEDGTLLEDGIRYVWAVRGVDGDGPGPWQTAAFTVDVARISPTPSDVVNITTPVITWPDLPGVAWYEVIVYNGDGDNDVLGSLDFFPAANTEFQAPYDVGICANGQCKAKPRTDIQFDLFDGGFANTGEFTVYVRAFSQTGSGANAFLEVIDPSTFGFTDVVLGYFELTSFMLTPPNLDGTAPANARVNLTGPLAEPGLPLFTVNRPEVEVKEIEGVLLGTTTTVAPSYYRTFIIPDDDVDFVFGDNAVDFGDGFVVDEWFFVANAINQPALCFDTDFMATDDCILLAFDGRQNLLYNGTYDLWIQGYVTELDGYTPWQYQGQFAINEMAPSADAILVAGTYNQIGSNPAFINEFSLTSTWDPCAESGCTTNRPIVHIKPDNDLGGEWMNIIAYNNTDNVITFENWFNINDSQFTGGNTFFCGDNFGTNSSFMPVFMTTTCFFQPAVLPTTENGFEEDFVGFENGKSYTWYVAQYGPGGFSTGGIFNVGYTDPDNNPGADFSIEGLPAPRNLIVDLDGSALTVTSIPALTESRIKGEPTFIWDYIPEASFYYFEVLQNGVLVEGGDWDFASSICQSIVTAPTYDETGAVNGFVERCVYRPGGFFFLENGTYTVNLAYWDGGVSQDASATFEVNNGAAMAPPAAEDTMIVYVDENLTSTTSPTFSWLHIQDNTWYTITIMDAGGNEVWPLDDALFGYRRAANFCTYRSVERTFATFFTFNSAWELRCDYTIDLADLILEPGTYTWSVTAFSPNGSVATGSSVSFEVAGTATGIPTPIWPAATTHTLTWTNTPTFYFEAAENAAWYNIFVGTFEDVVVFDWFYLPQSNIVPPMVDENMNESGQFWDASGVSGNYCAPRTSPISTGPSMGNMPINTGDAVVCQAAFSTSSDPTFRFYDELFLENGSFQWWIAPYGPAGFNTTDSVGGSGWFGPTTVTVDIPKTAPVNMAFASPNGSVSTSVDFVLWPRVPFAQFYYVEIIDTADASVLVSEFVSVEDAGCGIPNNSAFGTCILGVSGVDFSPYGVYEMIVATWGQGNDIVFTPDGFLDMMATFTYPVDNPATMSDESKAVFTKL